MGQTARNFEPLLGDLKDGCGQQGSVTSSVVAFFCGGSIDTYSTSFGPFSGMDRIAIPMRHRTVRKGLGKRKMRFEAMKLLLKAVDAPTDMAAGGITELRSGA